MNNVALENPAMNAALLAKLTGRLGDKATIEKLCAAFADVYIEFMPDMFKSETGLDVTIAYLGCDSGYKNDPIADLGANSTLVDATLRNWSQDITLACGNGFVITLMESLLGAAPETIEPPADRLLSAIELELAVMVFDKIAGVLPSMTTLPDPNSMGMGTGPGGGGGNGSGIGPGSGSGLGPGSGGGTGGGVYDVGNGVTEPKLIREVKPQYTADAMRAKVQGEVELEAVVNPDGSVDRIRVTRSLDRTFGLDQKAIEAVRQWRFMPGMRQGQPVAVRVSVVLDFTLR